MRRILLVLTVFLVVTSCSQDDSADEATSDVPSGVEAVVDDYIDAAVANDSAAWLETVTEDWFQTRYLFVPGTQQLMDMVDWESDPPEEYVIKLDHPEWLFEYEQLGDAIVTGDGPWYVTIPQSYTSIPNDKQPSVSESSGHMTYVVVERDGTYSVAAEVWTGTETLVVN